MSSVWGLSFGSAWGASWGSLVEFPQYVEKAWPQWAITEQVERATGGLLHLALQRRAAIRRGR